MHRMLADASDVADVVNIRKETIAMQDRRLRQ